MEHSTLPDVGGTVVEELLHVSFHLGAVLLSEEAEVVRWAEAGVVCGEGVHSDVTTGLAGSASLQLRIEGDGEGQIFTQN